MAVNNFCKLKTFLGRWTICSNSFRFINRLPITTSLRYTIPAYFHFWNIRSLLLHFTSLLFQIIWFTSYQVLFFFFFFFSFLYLIKDFRFWCYSRCINIYKCMLIIPYFYIHKYFPPIYCLMVIFNFYVKTCFKYHCNSSTMHASIYTYHFATPFFFIHLLSSSSRKVSCKYMTSAFCSLSHWNMLFLLFLVRIPLTLSEMRWTCFWWDVKSS